MDICVEGKRICNGVILLLQGPTLADDLLSLDLGDIDIIIGIPIEAFKIRHQ